jgi:hypothetical protein
MDAARRRLAVSGPRTALGYTVAVVGTVAVTTPGGGSTFVLSLPAAEQAAAVG